MTLAEDAAALLARTRKAQGLPPTLTEPEAIAAIATILAGTAEPAPARKAS